MSNNADLIAVLAANIKAYQDGLRQAAKDARAAGDAIEEELSGSMGKVEKALKVGAIAAGAALGGIVVAAGAAFAGLSALFKGAVEMAGGLQALSDKTGLAVEEIQRLRYAASQTGVEQESLDGAFEKFAIILGNAQNGVKGARAEFDALGVSLEDGKGKALDTNTVLLATLRRLEQFPDTAKRAAAGNGVFGKSAVEIAALASQGAGALDQMRQYADRAGIVIGGDLVTAGDNAGDAIDRLKFIIHAGLNKAILQVAPDVEKFIDELLADPDKMQQLMKDLVEIGKDIASIGGACITAGKFVVDFFTTLDSAAAYLNPAGDKLAKVRQEVEWLDKALADSAKINEDALPGRWQDKSREQLQAMRAERQGVLDQAEAVNKLVEAEKNRRALASQPPPPAAAGAPAKGGGPAYTDPAAAAAAAAEAAKAAAAKKSADAQIKAAHDRDQKIIEQARQRYATESELEQARYNMLKGSLEAISSMEFGGEDAKNKLLQSLEQDHQAALQKITDDAITAREESIDKGEAVLAERKQQRQQQLLGIVADNQASQTLAENLQYESRMKALEEYGDAELEMLGGYQAAKEALEQEHQDALSSIRQGALKSDLEFLGWIEDQKVRSAADGFANLIQIGGKNNKKLFKLSQAIALANAAVTLPSAIIKSYEAAGGYPWGIPAALAMAAAGAAQIAAIKNASYGGGASAPVAGAGASGGGVVGDTNARAAPAVSVTLVGNNFSAEQVRQLAEQLSEAYQDGARR